MAAKSSAAQQGAASRRLGKGAGFKAVQANIAQKQGISQERAGAILAASTRRASAGAKRANPNLKKVKG